MLDAAPDHDRSTLAHRLAERLAYSKYGRKHGLQNGVTTFEIIPARAHHCGQMARRLRHKHAEAVALMGMDSHREIRRCFDASPFRRAWLIDGKLGALGGIAGNNISTRGFVWLAVAQDAVRYPKAMVREARRQLAEIMSTRFELTTIIAEHDEASKRFALAIGFVPTHRVDPHPCWQMVYRKDEQERPWPSRLH